MKIINLDKRQYLSPEAFGHGSTLEDIAGTRDGVMQALIVLCADSNGEGGGDLESEADIVGTWAGDRIAIVSSKACDATLSAPGAEDVPLLEQMVNAGLDISELIIAAILDGEGESSGLYGLPADVSHRVTFRRMFGSELRHFGVRGDGTERFFMSLEELLSFLNSEVEETLTATFVGVANGVNRIAEAFGLAVRWSFTSKALAAQGVRRHVVTFTSDGGEEATLDLDFNGKKLTASFVLETFGLSEVLRLHGPSAPQSMLPAAIVKIINETLEGRNVKGQGE